MGIFVNKSLFKKKVTNLCVQGSSLFFIAFCLDNPLLQITILAKRLHVFCAKASPDNKAHILKQKDI
jgi:hypothetical protein